MGADFEDVGKIASGKFGTVYRARNVITDDIFAAKHVKTRKKSVLEMVMEEVSILKTLSHEHILVMHGAFQSRNEVIVVTEFLSGGELFEKVATDDYHLTEAECVRFMYQICDAVSYLHRKGTCINDVRRRGVGWWPKDTK